MAKEGRNEKGQFLPGRKPPVGRQSLSTGVAREMQERSAEERVRNGIIAKAVQRALLGKDPETGEPMLDRLVNAVVARTLLHGSAGDIRILADVLGELEQKVEVSGDIDFKFKFGE